MFATACRLTRLACLQSGPQDFDTEDTACSPTVLLAAQNPSFKAVMMIALEGILVGTIVGCVIAVVLTLCGRF